MIEIEPEPWQAMLAHARGAYPRECCGIMIGNAGKVTIAVPCRNAYEGGQEDRFEIDPREQLSAEKRSRELGLGVLGFFHSHPDCGAYFSQTDLKNHWPFYSNVVISIVKGEFADAKAFQVDVEQTASTEEELIWPKS